MRRTVSRYEIPSDDLLAPCATEGGTFRESAPARPQIGPWRADRPSAVPAMLFTLSVAVLAAIGLIV